MSSAYLAASLDERKERQAAEAERQAHEAQLEQRSRRFLRALVGVFAVATVIAILLSGVAFNQSNIAQENAATATFAQGEALVLATSRHPAGDCLEMKQMNAPRSKPSLKKKLQRVPPNKLLPKMKPNNVRLPKPSPRITCAWHARMNLAQFR